MRNVPSVPDSLVSSSSLTARQLQCLEGYIRVVSGELKLREAASLSSKGRVKGNPSAPVTTGSFQRTVRQARNNIKQSVGSVFIAVSLGLIRLDDATKLLQLASQGRKDLSDEDRQKLQRLVEVILDRIVT